MARYLLQNASTIGHRTTPVSQDYAMMLLPDGNSYELCVTAHERCLRSEFAGTNSREERDALLAGKAAYAYDRALACLQRAGDAWPARMPTQETEYIPNLKELYEARILPRLVGNMMPVAVLSDSSFFGIDNENLHATALKAVEHCLQTLSGTPVDRDRLVERISSDQVAALDCVEDMHKLFTGWTKPHGR